MNRKELIRRTAGKMREKDIRKPVTMPKQVFHVSDDDGNKKDFVLRKSDKNVLFTVEDVEAVIDSCLEVISDALKHGETVTVKGFGSLGLRHYKPRSIRHVETGEEIIIPERYIPRFSFGNELRMCARVYELSLEDCIAEHRVPMFGMQDEVD